MKRQPSFCVMNAVTCALIVIDSCIYTEELAPISDRFDIYSFSTYVSFINNNFQRFKRQHANFDL